MIDIADDFKAALESTHEEEFETFKEDMPTIFGSLQKKVAVCVYVCIRHGSMNGPKSMIRVDGEDVDIYGRMSDLGVLKNAKRVVVIDFSCRDIVVEQSDNNRVPPNVIAYLTPTKSGNQVYPIDVICNMAVANVGLGFLNQTLNQELIETDDFEGLDHLLFVELLVLAKNMGEKEEKEEKEKKNKEEDNDPLYFRDPRNDQRLGNNSPITPIIYTRTDEYLEFPPEKPDDVAVTVKYFNTSASASTSYRPLLAPDLDY